MITQVRQHTHSWRNTSVQARINQRLALGRPLPSAPLAMPKVGAAGLGRCIGALEAAAALILASFSKKPPFAVWIRSVSVATGSQLPQRGYQALCHHSKPSAVFWRKVLHVRASTHTTHMLHNHTHMRVYTLANYLERLEQ